MPEGEQMKMGQIRTVGVCAIVSAAALGSAAQAEQMWQRSADWVPGAPGPGGPATWTYEYTSSGGALTDAFPWYSMPSTAMSWDANWWESGQGVWSAGDDVSPPVDQNRMAHNVAASASGNVPLIRFANTTGLSSLFDVTGVLKVVWDGVGGVGRPTSVDVIVGKQDAAHASTTLLYSTTVNKPNNFASVGDFIDLAIVLDDVLLGQGESIVVSHRARTPVEPGGWIHLHDMTTITTIPAPGAAAAIGLGGLLALRRRRR